MTFSEALERFEKWYNDCIEEGLEPEEIVESIGEMKLLTNQDDIDIFDEAKDEA